MTSSIIIIGTGLAGYQLAREFRKIDKDSPLTMITADDGRYYPKPQLSTALTLKKTSENLVTATADEMAAQLNARIITKSPVDSFHPEKKQVIIRQETLIYDKLILACGANVIKPNLTGKGSEDILSINHIYHYATFQKINKK